MEYILFFISMLNQKIFYYLGENIVKFLYYK